MTMAAPPSVLAISALLLSVSVSLQGCGGGSSGSGVTTTTSTSTSTPTTNTPSTSTKTTTTRTSTTTTTTEAPHGNTTTTTTKPTPPPPKGWRTHPVEVRGSHLFDGVTGAPWRAKGIGFPNVGDDVDEWINVLKRIAKMSPDVNLIRIYVLPKCALTSDCMRKFMKEADALGIYALVPGTGTEWGWLPGPGACHNASECYRAGGVLGWGQTVASHFNYPNVLAIVIGNEFDMQMRPYMPVIKAYARDLKSYMKMCNEHKDSPAKGKMRQIPLLYASSDDGGDTYVRPKMSYLFCGGRDVSIDIFGLNLERWCQTGPGRATYDVIDKWVAAAKNPGAFMTSEEGCTKMAYPNKTRDWAQLPDMFSNFTHFDGFVAYTYYGNPNFDMFSNVTSKAEVNEDGKVFFEQIKKVGHIPNLAPGETVTPTCAKKISHKDPDFDDVDDVPIYDTGKTGWAPQCARPLDYEEEMDIVVT